jgi:hypothetical protein
VACSFRVHLLMTLELQAHSVVSVKYFPHKGNSMVYIGLSENGARAISPSLLLKILQNKIKPCVSNSIAWLSSIRFRVSKSK